MPALVRASAVYISFGASSRSVITDCPHLRNSVKDASELAELYLQLPLSMKSRQNEKLKTIFRAERDRKDCAVALMFGKALSLLYLMLLVLLSSQAALKL